MKAFLFSVGYMVLSLLLRKSGSPVKCRVKFKTVLTVHLCYFLCGHENNSVQKSRQNTSKFTQFEVSINLGC